MYKEELIKQYLNLYSKLGKTPSVNDLKNERKNNKDFPSFHQFIKYFKKTNNIAKECNLPINKRKSIDDPDRKNNSLRIFLRNYATNWKKATEDCWKNKSCICNSDDYEVIHHDYPFYKIINEIFDITNYDKSDNIKNYSLEQLENMGKLCEELHFKHGLGYCMTNKEHGEFHKIYGIQNFEGKTKEFMDYKLNKITECTPNNDIGIIEGEDIYIFKEEIDFILKNNLPEKAQLILLLLLIHNKMLKNVNNEFYLTYNEMEKYGITNNTYFKYLNVFKEKNIVEVRKDKIDNNRQDIKNIINIIKLNYVNSNITNEFVSIKMNYDIYDIYYYLLYKFYKTRKAIKKLITDKAYRRYCKYDINFK